MWYARYQLPLPGGNSKRPWWLLLPLLSLQLVAAEQSPGGLHMREPWKV